MPLTSNINQHHHYHHQLPDELWIDIFMYLTDSLSSIFIHVPLTCKRFFRIIYHMDDNFKQFIPSNHHQAFDHHQVSSSQTTTTTTTTNNRSTSTSTITTDHSVLPRRSEEEEDHHQHSEIASTALLHHDEWFVDSDTTRVNEPLYKLLLELYSLNNFDQNDEHSTTTFSNNTHANNMKQQYRSYRTCFEIFKLFGFTMNNLFRKELCYSGTMITNLEAYKNTKTASPSMQESLPSGNTVVMTENFGSSSAGVNVVNRPMMYNSGIHYFEFIVHKSGQYDNFLIGIVLTERLNIENCKQVSGEKLEDRFNVDAEYSFQFRDYLGSLNSFSIAIYEEGNCVYHKSHSIYNCNQKKQYCTVEDENIVKANGYVIGVYLDTKNYKIAFAKNGAFVSSMDFSQKMIDHPRYEAGQLAFYPALSMGQTNDACTFSTKMSLQKCSAIRRAVKELVFEKK
ncbi:hypothetical protein FDP41_009466 [Naegleria fowleri]|uniref:B30.2/SPRY domain-containing protein n=1 Tax=Naegleria fowleri TaxID=5763 RepID=A0A6A5BBC1_NAEFO|nr:uncharacterized protein FDP41_009466 [Naegleria fowleri]KAF0972262.1 hypothetical protein FDP41_009466 [Naegleria fowleri]